MFDKILIANRGEIAVRIIKTAKKLGIKTAIVYSEADINSLAVQLVDEAYFIGAPPAKDSYLNIPKILEAVKDSGADAVHPGYGFLSENCEFATELEKMGVTFIGPSKSAILAMGDKITSKKIAIEAGVDTVPGYLGEIHDDQEAIKIADEIGFPVMIKAAAGGGGRGMRIVYDTKSVVESYKSAAKEAINCFGDGRLFIEKFIEKPRHIEIQVLGDKFGNVVCVGERECSIQRYNQKVIEEAPSPFLDDKTRAKMYEQSIKLAQKVGYYSAGTVEYIVDSKRNFYFLEMNTRLQVEHPVTELVTGYDLVEEMIKVAAGKKLSMKQQDIKLKGWAMESRIYAEDPSRNFLPSSGRIHRYQEPVSSKHVRVDSGVYEGAEVSMFYDAMIAKLCSYGKDRKEAIDNMKGALSEYIIDGVAHNIKFLERVMRNKKFEKGDFSTNFIAEHYPEGFNDSEAEFEDIENIIAAAGIIRLTQAERLGNISDQMEGREKKINNRWVVCINKDNYYIQLDRIAERQFAMQYNGRQINIESSWNVGDRLFKAVIDDSVHVNVQVMYEDGGYILTNSGVSKKVRVLIPRVAELFQHMPVDSVATNVTNLAAPISGKIVEFRIKVGESFKMGQELVLLEAMKMENLITADCDGKVKKLLVKDGAVVAAEQIIIEFA